MIIVGVLKLAGISIPLAKPEINEEMEKKIVEVLKSRKYVLGEENLNFENEFSNMVSRKYSISVNSGTAALYSALHSIGISSGDEIILPSFTFWASAEVILLLGAFPVFCDINPDTYCIDDQKIESLISKKTKAIMPVHLFGHPSNSENIDKIANDNDLFVIEDCCQGLGSLYLNSPVGSFGDISCFSFYPSKNMTVAGDGGMIVTNDHNLAEKNRMFRNHGRSSGYTHNSLGFNFRLNEINAAIGRIQLSYLSDLVSSRRQIAALYNSQLKSCSDIILPTEESWASHSYTNYVIKSNRRDDLAKWLNDQGVSTAVHYPVPCHKQPAYLSWPKSRSFSLPETDSCSEQVLTIPLYPHMSSLEISHVTDSILSFYK
jgi:perosamine synthetase